MKLRNGKRTASQSKIEVKTMCKHTCEMSLPHLCCACSDRRPIQTTYIAHDRSNLADVSYVERNHYYCQHCKAKPTPKALDLTKSPKKSVSVGFVFPKSTEQKLAEALVEIEKLKKSIQIISDGASKVEDALKEENEKLKSYVEREMTADIWKNSSR